MLRSAIEGPFLPNAGEGPAPSTTKRLVDILSGRRDWRLRVYGGPAISIDQEEEFWKSEPALLHEELSKDVIIIQDNDPFEVLRSTSDTSAKLQIDDPEELRRGALVIDALFSDKRMRTAFWVNYCTGLSPCRLFEYWYGPYCLASGSTEQMAMYICHFIFYDMEQLYAPATAGLPTMFELLKAHPDVRALVLTQFQTMLQEPIVGVLPIVRVKIREQSAQLGLGCIEYEVRPTGLYLYEITGFFVDARRVPLKDVAKRRKCIEMVKTTAREKFGLLQNGLEGEGNDTDNKGEDAQSK